MAEVAGFTRTDDLILWSL